MRKTITITTMGISIQTIRNKIAVVTEEEEEEMIDTMMIAHLIVNVADMTVT